MPFNSTYTAVVPAAGIGKRMAASCPKQYLSLAGLTLIEHSIMALKRHKQIGQVIVVLHPEDETFANLSIAQQPWLITVVGGAERSDSVMAGLQRVEPGEQWVLVHDAARPCLALDDLNNLLSLAQTGHVGGILAAPVRDTMKRAHPDQSVYKTESRENLWHALTPQFFPLAELKAAMIKAKAKQVAVTDEASAIEYAGGKVKLVLGSASNIKVTQPEDLLLAEFYLQQALATGKTAL
jgi:2-C-methyl-D-erythritol 4-phosphate cytidylyltransferase